MKEFGIRRFEVFEDGSIFFIPNEYAYSFDDDGDEIELLYKAVEKSKELRK